MTICPDRLINLRHRDPEPLGNSINPSPAAVCRLAVPGAAVYDVADCRAAQPVQVADVCLRFRCMLSDETVKQAEAVKLGQLAPGEAGDSLR